MKELTIEQKAKAYDRALEIAKAWCKLDNNDLSNDDLKTIFPELKESDDEKTRKEIVGYLKRNLRLEWAAWLEKQGGQKPQRIISAEAKEAMYDKPACAWSEEDKEMCQETIDWFEKKCFPYALESENPAKESIKWLKSLKDRVHPQQEWNAKDKGLRDLALWCVNQEEASYDGELFSQQNFVDAKYWLKSLRPQPKQEWSEEDQNALEDVREAVVHYWGGETQDILLYWLKSLKQRIAP